MVYVCIHTYIVLICIYMNYIYCACVYMSIDTDIFPQTSTVIHNVFFKMYWNTNSKHGPMVHNFNITLILTPGFPVNSKNGKHPFSIQDSNIPKVLRLKNFEGQKLARRDYFKTYNILGKGWPLPLKIKLLTHQQDRCTFQSRWPWSSPF